MKVTRKHKFIKWISSLLGIEVFFEQITFPVEPMKIQYERFDHVIVGVSHVIDERMFPPKFGKIDFQLDNDHPVVIEMKRRLADDLINEFENDIEIKYIDSPGRYRILVRMQLKLFKKVN